MEYQNSAGSYQLSPRASYIRQMQDSYQSASPGYEIAGKDYMQMSQNMAGQMRGSYENSC